MLARRNNLLSSIKFYYNCCSSSMTTTTAAAAATASGAAIGAKPRFYFFKKVSTLASIENLGGFGKNNVLRLRGCISSGNKINGVLDQLELLRDSDELGSRILNGFSSFKGSFVGFPNKFGDLPEKISVAVDVDEVLGSFLSALNDFIEDRYSSKHSISEYYVYEFFKVWNCSRNEADVRVHEFFKTSYFKKGIYPIPGALEALQKLSKYCDLSIVTSRQNIIKDHTIEWVEKHYPGIFKEIHFGNHFALDGKSRPKSDICRSLGAQVLIDDNPRYAIECAGAGIRVLLFDLEDAYPWSKMETIDQHPLITKVLNWKEVEHQMASWIIS